MSVEMSLSSRINFLTVHSLASKNMSCIFQFLKVGTSSGQIPYPARESNSDDISTLMDDPEIEYSVLDFGSERHYIPDLEEYHEGADYSERESH